LVTAVELAPILNASDWNASAEWFDKVGFERGFTWSRGRPVDARSPEPDLPPTFGSVIWGDIRIFLCLDAQGGRGDDGVWLSIFVDDVDAVHARCLREGLEITRQPVDEV
jgi:hypothetical protein